MKRVKAHLEHHRIEIVVPGILIVVLSNAGVAIAKVTGAL